MLAEGARPVDRRFEVDRTVAAVRFGVGQVVGADDRLLQDQVAELVSAAGHVLRGCLGACQMVVVLGVERAFDGDGESFGYPVAEVLREREERLRRVVELLAVTGLRQQHVIFKHGVDIWLYILGIAPTCRAVLHALTVFLCVLAFHIDRKPDNDSPDNADKQVHRGKTRQGI